MPKTVLDVLEYAEIKQRAKPTLASFYKYMSSKLRKAGLTHEQFVFAAEENGLFACTMDELSQSRMTIDWKNVPNNIYTECVLTKKEWTMLKMQLNALIKNTAKTE